MMLLENILWVIPGVFFVYCYFIKMSIKNWKDYSKKLTLSLKRIFHKRGLLCCEVGIYGHSFLYLQVEC